MESIFKQPAPHPKHKRNPKWQELMHYFLMDRRQQPFAWGTNDCCMFVADHIQTVTGFDMAADYRGQYGSEWGAAKMFAAAGGLENFVALEFKKHGMTEIPVVFAQRADVLLNRQNGSPALMVMDFDGIHALGIHETKGIVRVPALHNCARAWRIG